MRFTAVVFANLVLLPRAEPMEEEAAVLAHVGDVHELPSVKAASLLLEHSQSCVDGRDVHPVVGTPGGDAGELLLALAALEHVRGAAFTSSEVEHVFDAYLESFGRFYMHTDEHALAFLRRDPRFAEALAGRSLDDLVHHPPPHLEDALLTELVEPEHVGCGHLRLLLLRPEVYGVRPALTRDVLRLALLRLWRGGPIDFVVLEGRHEEQAVMNVRLGYPVHAFTRIPTVSPHLVGERGERGGDHEVFVNHPEVSAWVRSENAAFLVEVDPWLREDSARLPLLIAELTRLGDLQLKATLGSLASELPMFDVVLGPDEARVTRVVPAPSKVGTLLD